MHTTHARAPRTRTVSRTTHIARQSAARVQGLCIRCELSIVERCQAFVVLVFVPQCFRMWVFAIDNCFKCFCDFVAMLSDVDLCSGQPFGREVLPINCNFETVVFNYFKH